MFTLCKTAGSLKRYILKVYMHIVTAYSAVGAAANSTKSTKSIILKNLLNKIVRRKHIQYSFEFN